MLVKIFGTSWKSTKRILVVSCLVCLSFALVAALLAWKTVDSMQNDDESPLRLAFSPETLELFFDDDKEEHIARAEYSVLRGEYCASTNDYSGAHTNFAEAVNELTDYIGLDVGLSRMVLLRAGTVEQQFHKYDLAEKYFLASIKHPLPKSLPKALPIFAWSHIADCYEERDLWLDAIRHRRLIVDLATKLNSPSKTRLVNALISLGGTYGNNENYPEALKCVDDAIALVDKQSNSNEKLENKASAYAWRGYLNLALHKYQTAVDDLTVSISLNKGSEWSYFYRGRALQLLGRFDQALRDYNKAVAENPEFALEHYRRGQTLAVLGDHNGAIADFSLAEKFARTNQYVIDLDSSSKSRHTLLLSSAQAARKVEEALVAK